MDTSHWQARLQGLATKTPPRWVLLALLLLALVVRGRVILAGRETLDDDPDGYRWVAASVYYDGVFAVRENPDLPTARRAPLYPLVLAVTYYARLPVAYIVGFLHAVLGLGTVWATWRLGRQYRLPSGASLAAAALVAVDPLLLWQSVQPMTETMATFLAVAALLAVGRAAGGASPVGSVAAGALLGLCVLCRPVFLVWMGLIGCVFAWRAVRARSVVPLAALAAGAALALAPWTIRNVRELGAPVVTTTHGGFTLLLANNPDFYEYLRHGSWGSVWDGSSVNGTQEQPLAPVDEIELDRANYRKAFANIRAEPVMFARSCLARLGRLWNVLPHQTSADESTARRGLRYSVAIGYTFEFALAAAGIWFLRGKVFAPPWLWATLLVLSITLVHAFFWTDMRMRAPLVPVVALVAAYGATLLACGRDVASADGGAL
jgi:hypothetical protein